MKHSVPFLLLVSVVLSGAAGATEQPDEAFKPEWASLRRYECPEWFRDAKFGIYAHWGVYSAAKGTHNTDWYGRHMYEPDQPNHADHLKNFGPVSTFGYKDIIPLFTAEKFNADEWAKIFAEAGAKFAGPVGEHADGFSMWDSTVNPWNAAKMGPKRDVVGELGKAMRKRGLKFFVSLHHSWLWGWFPTWDKNTDASDPAYASFYGPSYPQTSQGLKLPSGKLDYGAVHPLPSAEFQRVWLEKVKEVVTRYSPDVLWFDSRLRILTETTRKEMVAFYLNHAWDHGQEVVLSYKVPDLVQGAGTTDLERARMPDIYPEPWLTDLSVARSSWGYATDLKLYTADRLVDDLVDIVSKNGCLLLNVAPAPDGTIPDDQKAILRGMGRWLKVNGEAIYGSRPWLLFGEGPTQTPVGSHTDLGFQGFGSSDIRFTLNQGTLYAIALGWPENGSTVTIKALSTLKTSEAIREVTLLGHAGKLMWRRTTEGLVINLPAERPCDYAYVFKISHECD